MILLSPPVKMNVMENILDFSFDELKQAFSGDKMPQARAGQLFDWIYKKFVFDFGQMSNLSKELRQELQGKYGVLALEKIESAGSMEQETLKFLFRCSDGEMIETVLIIAEDPGADEDDPSEMPSGGGNARLTLCVSSQSGCALGCGFCATGKLGFKRDLSTAEILSQVLWVERYLADKQHEKKQAGRRLSNIVFMGMGEPMLNYDRVLKSIRILNDPKGYNLGIRHFTLSTAGVVPGIKRLEDEKAQVRLAVSLHTADQTTRETLMPVAKKYRLDELVASLRSYQDKTGRRITLEYILMEGVNDTEKDVRLVKERMDGMTYNLNVIAYNEVDGLPYRSPTENTVRRFTGYLKQYQIPYVFRKSKGRSIRAACGQLGLYWKGLSGR